ncbi:polysaccharide deacetylase family protein [Paenibacillus tuaregi]|uniref:polysaccharide deacetylase family protein n=1 Tax=Paenibacillus tuaregi TaxID=1816681 RepID=UPI0009EDC404|nr:polysaccharide deacetylase family protein [Paenibacillus tuaregi]
MLKLLKQVLMHTDYDKREVALTFDDGPHALYTEKILDILGEYNIKATFFLLGEHVRDYPDIAKRIAAEGHTVGNHTYSHPNLTTLTYEEIHDELTRTEQEIILATGIRPKLFRPPYGEFNELVLRAAGEMNYKTVYWSQDTNRSLDTKDWAGPIAEEILQHIKNNICSGGIVLMHDGGGDRTQTILALAPIIEFLQKENFTLIPLH